MTIEVEVIAKEIIRPSSPTPHHLQDFPLSGLDQLHPVSHSPFYLFFHTIFKHKTEKIPQINHLKQSLAETLTHIYPLAGRISDNIHVICNDEGVNFFESIVTGDKLSQFLGDPVTEELEKLLPKDELLVLEEAKALLSVQLNFFDCGGIALGILISHKIADGFSIYLFLNLWARICRGEEEIHPPKLGTTSTFPPNNLLSALLTTSATTTTEKLVTKRFVFNTANIASIRGNMLTKCPSRSATVIAVIWKCITNAIRMRGGRTKTASSVATFAVNLRRKQLPDLSEITLGNCTVCTTTTPTGENDLELPDLVDKFKEAIRIIDSEYVKQLKAGDIMFLEPFGEVNELCGKGEMERCLFSSICNFPYYEIDFGWGKPIWATLPVVMGHKNSALLIDAKCGTGVETWVCLEEEDMARFEHDPYLIAFTSSSNAALSLDS